MRDPGPASRPHVSGEDDLRPHPASTRWYPSTWARRAMIRLEGLSKSYDEGRSHAVRDIDLSVAEG